MTRFILEKPHFADPTLAVIFLALFFLPVTQTCRAQESDPGGFTRLSWGIKGGLALAQHQGTTPRDMEYTVSSTMRRGVAAGVFLILPVTPRFGIQQEVLYVQKGSRQEIGVEIFDVPAVLNVTYDMDYIEIPLLLRYHWLIDRGVDIYSLGGFAFALKVKDRYQLTGEVDDGVQSVPIRADSDMSEVDLFDFAFTYGVGLEFPLGNNRLLVEYRFDLSIEALPLPTYAYIPFGDEQILVDNEPVPLRNQCHMLMLGIRF
jgi:hypothetical protein